MQALDAITHRLSAPTVCPHITLLGPFVDRGDVDDELVGTIREVLEPVRAFDFELSALGQFMGGLTYLTPDPAEPFIQLTEMFAAAFPQWPPYGGAFDEVVPHLSIGEALLQSDVAVLRELLPVGATAEEVTLTWWSEHVAEVLVRFPLRPQRSHVTMAATTAPR
ncbi:2'-5' RNA ligase family protein [Cellulomonas fimi]|uniref:2'-5' RNA ligase family protein n=1 Tax=Cellulomonas fimi TaxID=1708 RepID=UPI001E51ED8B|nr:2'-5' RNA ligase family protein [Cellulomonas fimi]